MGGGWDLPERYAGRYRGKLVFGGRFWGARILRSTVRAGRQVLRAEWVNSGGVYPT